MAALGFPEGPVDEEFVRRRVEAVRRVGIPDWAGYVLVVVTGAQARELLGNLRERAATPIGRYRMPEAVKDFTLRMLGARFVCTLGEAVVVELR